MSKLGPQFWRLWAASTASNLGDGAALTALPLLAATFTRDPALIAGLTFALTLPWLLFALPAGVIADRADRQKLLVGAALARCGLTLMLGLLTVAGWASLPWLYLTALLLGVTEVLFDSASQTILTAVVPTRQLESANSRLFVAILMGNRLLGPPVGGTLFSLGAAVPLFLHSVLLGFAGGLVSTLRGTFRAEMPDNGKQANMAQSIFEGMRWLLGNRLLCTIAIIAGIENLLGTACFAILVLYALEVLQLSEASYGILLTSSAFGGLLGTLVVNRVIERIGHGTAIFWAILTEGVSYLGMTLLPNPYLMGGMLALHAFSNVFWGVIVLSLRQAIIPNHLLGRVGSVGRLIAWGVIPVGAVLGGWLAGTLGLLAPFYLAATVIVVLAFVTLPYTSNSVIRAARSHVTVPGGSQG